ncbi:peptide ABC transporter substrate-binding protein [Microbacterium sediminis]|uniref:peptide ABC transporter substrate-binding protein n=1 Tax=Microbacterium sediminis TaxID=904291 RepID=UPI000A035025|nr:ABC transporter substrate-binding protein [Microbacterium sediminis]QBR73507.1 ABC transporter substrate-binding protein [Microbacterium sediminis]
MTPSRLRRSLLSGAALATLGITVLAGCSAGGDDTSPSGSSDGDTSVSIAVTDPGILIPGRQTIAFEFAGVVWSPLTFIHDDGTLDYVQAESVESDDQQTWTITLRDGWTFHDGTPVTAQDYVDSWNWVAYGPNAAENSGQLVGIQGFDEVNAPEPTAETMSGLKVIDDLTFEVTLKVPDSQFPIQLSQGQTATFPMPASAFDDMDAYNAHPIGNGPFEMAADYVEAETVTVTAYDDFAGEEPTVDEIDFVPYVDTATAYTDVQAGNLDIVFVPASRLAQAEADFGDHFMAFDAPGISFLGLSLWEERFSDVRVRQALSMAIDRETINEQLYAGIYTPATAWTPVVEAGTPEGLCGEFCEYDPEAAAALLEEAGGFEGPLEIVYPGGSGLDELYNAIANNLRQNLGIDAVATPTADWAEFAERRTAGDISGAFFSRWGALYPSQQATMRELYLETGGCDNCVAWYSDEVAAGLQEADANPSTDGSAYAAVQEIIQDNFPVPPLFSEAYPYVTSQRVAEMPAAAGSPILHEVVISE